MAQQFKNSLPLHEKDDKNNVEKESYDANGTHLTQITQSPGKQKENEEISDEEGLI